VSSRDPDRVDGAELDRWPTFALDHTVDSDGCTVYPPSGTVDPDRGVWIFAAPDAHVGLEEVR